MESDKIKSLRCAAAIIAGGKSSRMGQDKALLQINGERLIDIVARVLRTSFDEIYIVGLPSETASMPFPQVPDLMDEKSSLNGLLSALHHSPTEWVALFSCDAPEPCPALIRHMLDHANADVDAVVVIDCAGHLHPFHGLWNRRSIPVLTGALTAGNLKLRPLIANLKHTAIPPESWRVFDSDGKFLINLNTPEDVADWSRRPVSPVDI